MPTFSFGPVDVQVRKVSEEVPPWGDKIVFKYGVMVKSKHGRYHTSAWGSIADYEKNKLDEEGIGAMVIGELASAAADPDEFIEMVMGEKTGREALKAGRDAEKIITAAKRFGDDIFEASDVVRERGLD